MSSNNTGKGQKSQAYGHFLQGTPRNCIKNKYIGNNLALTIRTFWGNEQQKKEM